MDVYGFGPLLEEFPLGPVLLGILALDLQDQHLTAREPDQEVGDILLNTALIRVEDFEA